MCLYKARKIQQEGEITCYKVLIQLISDYGEKFYRSPYQFGTTWEVGETKTAWFKRRGNEKTIVDEHGNISTGAFHTFKTMDDAVKYADRLGNRSGVRGYIAECVIPADCRYVYEGEVYGFYDFWSIDGYASQKLRVVKVTEL